MVLLATQSQWDRPHRLLEACLQLFNVFLILRNNSLNNGFVLEQNLPQQTYNYQFLLPENPYQCISYLLPKWWTNQLTDRLTLQRAICRYSEKPSCAFRVGCD